MAASQTKLIFSLLVIFNSLFLLLTLPTSAVRSLISSDAIYLLGDSISDTGNLIRESKSPLAAAYGRLPYGISNNKTPTGRCCDGLLMIDRIALSLKLPLLNPYLAKDSNFTHGVNFAVAGATALDSSFLEKNLIFNPVTNSSLSVQLRWLKYHLNHTRKEGAAKLKKSIFFVGEIGGNDYNYAFLEGRTIDNIIYKLRTLVPPVIQTIKRTVMELIKLGASRIIVPGNFPIGCLPIYLTLFQTNYTTAYDEFKCLIRYNSFSISYNDQLQQALQKVRDENPNVHIAYADYYNAFKWIYTKAYKFGFHMETLQKACCGTGGNHNFDLESLCGCPVATVCPDPDTHVSWDGIHLTEKAYMHMVDWLLKDLTPKICIHADL